MMFSSRWSRSVGAVSFLVCCVCGTDIPSGPSALSVTPSTAWYGDDGVWSAVSIRFGNPQQWIDIMVSTVSSENWVVGPGGCDANDSTCMTARGNLFFPNNSTTWRNEGFYALGTDEVLGNTGYGNYGLDELSFGTTGISLPSAIIGAFNGSGLVNTTQYMLGFFGLGVIQCSFNGTSYLSVISSLVETQGVIPSHSYGYTAGAHYQQKGVPNSLTLGGYDANRFVPHDISFNLNPSKLPQVFVSSISVASSASNNWTNPAQLLEPADTVTAIIDSSTPYLWLPQAVCERFAKSLGLSYDSSLNLYTFDANVSQHATLANSQLTFTFSLADFTTSNNIINITLPYAAFDLELTYGAIPGTVYGAANASKFYFPLRQANSSAQYTIGRSFLQEAYIITDYERNNFSVHQAVHTSDPLSNTSIVSIDRPSTSTFTGPPNASKSKSKSKLSLGAIVGIVAGVAVVVVLGAIFAVLTCRRRKTQMDPDEKLIETQPRSLMDRLRGRQRPPNVHEASGSTVYPTEVAADATHERFELPAPLGPAELDSDSGSLDGSTENGSSTLDSTNISEYERARRKMERQQAAAAATLNQPLHGTYPEEKTEVDISQVAHYRPSDIRDIESPLVSPLCPESVGTFSVSDQHSPVSPGFVSLPNTPTGPPTEPPPIYRRINPSNVIYAGRLPYNVQLPSVVPRMVGIDGRTVRVEETLSTQPEGTNSSLGSNFTENENREAIGTIYSSGDTNIVSPIASGSTGSGHGSADTNIVSPIASDSTASDRSRNLQLRVNGNEDGLANLDLDPWPSRRRLGGEDLVHIPQPAENRFSWEEERISGKDEE